MTLFRRIKLRSITAPLAWTQDGEDVTNDIEIIVEQPRTRLKRIAVRVLNMRPGWHRQLGRLAAVRLVEPYEWTPGYLISVRPPKPRGGWV